MTGIIREKKQEKYIYMEMMNNRMRVQQPLTSIISKRGLGRVGSWLK